MNSKKLSYSSDFDESGTSPTICPVVGIPIPPEDLHHINPCAKPRKHFLKFFLDVSFYLCVIPYKIVATVEGTYKKEGFRFQQVLCLIVHIAAVLDITTCLRAVPFSQVSENPRMYFDIIIMTVHTAVICTFCYTMWRKSNEFGWLVGVLHMCPIVSTWYPKRINLFMSLVTIVYVTMSLLNPFFGDGDGYSWGALFNLHAARGRYMLFFSSESVSLKKNYQLNKMAKISPADGDTALFGFPDILFAAFSYFANTSQWIVVYHADLIMNVMSLTLWTATTYFINTLKVQGCKTAVLNYEALKTLVGHINSVAGMIVLTYTVDSIFYYATNLESLFTGKNWFAKLVVVQFLISFASWLHFASCACLQMEKFRDWIRHKENRCALPTKSISIMLLLDEISTNSVGLSGNGLFTINYKFVAQALTTVMTYFILVIQFK